MDDLDTSVQAFRLFAQQQATKASPASPLYTALGGIIWRALDQGGASGELISSVLAGSASPNLLLAAVHQVLLARPDAPLAAYYRSLGGRRLPDGDLAGAFDAFLAEHRVRIAGAVATSSVQTNDVLRAAQLMPAFGWAQAQMRRPLGLIEIGPSAGFLLHADCYGYCYEFADGSTLAGGTHRADEVPVLRCAVAGPASASDLAPFVVPHLQVASRVGLDLHPLDPTDPAARDWLNALIWPEHAERRERLDAALKHAVSHPVPLHAGDALGLLPAAVDAVPGGAVACVFSSSCLAHFPGPARSAFVDLLREVGARRDVVFVAKEGHWAGLGLFTGAPDPVADSDPDTGAREVLAAVAYRNGRERIFRLGTAGRHGQGLDWAPTSAG